MSHLEGETACMDQLLAAQRRYFNSGATRPLAFRRRMLARLEDGLRRWEGRLLAALKADLNKQPAEGYMSELALSAGEARYARRHLGRWARPSRGVGPVTQFPSTISAYPEPLGTALIIAPWNYPFFLTLAPLVSAMAAGCTAVVKPSEDAPACSHALAQMLGELFPPEYVAVAEGDRGVAEALLEQSFDTIFFTGSPAVGKLVMAAAARRLIPVTLELGGKSPVILAPDADVELAAARVAWGKFLNAGQTCVAPDHVWVPEGMADRFVDALARQITRFYGPEPLAGEELPRIVNRRHFDRLVDWMKGGTVVIGGQTDPERLRIAPTVLVEPAEGSPLVEEEIFGPLLPVLPYRSLPELLDEQRQKPRPLALYLFTRSRETERAVLGGLTYGGGCVNDTIVHLTDPRLPFGGVGNSGMGACHGKAGFDAFTHWKSVLKKGRLDLPLRYPPYGEDKLRKLKKFM